MKKIMIIIGIIIGIWFINSWFQPFIPIEVHTVNVTEVRLQNSGILVWGYWDNSTNEECVGLFQSGFMPHDADHIYEVHFKEWPDPDIRCLKLVKKIELS